MVHTAVVKKVVSSDGTELYADAVGKADREKIAIVFIHGGSLSADVFDNVFFESDLSNDYLLVRSLLPILIWSS